MGRTSNADQRIIEAALRLFREKGFSAVGISEVCDAADVNKGSFCHFFKSKQALALAVVDDYAEASAAAFAVAEDTDLPPLERIRILFEGNAQMHCESASACAGMVHGCMFGNFALELSTQDELVRERVEHHIAAQVAQLQVALDAAVDDQSIPAQDTAQSARLLISLLQGGVLMAKVGRRPEDLHALADSALRLIGATTS